MLGIACLMMFACAKVDYAYRHDVAGRVVDGQTGRAVPGAIVERIEDGCLDAVRDMYRRETDANGCFRFEYSGLGGKPEQCRSGCSRSKLGYQSRTITNTVAWQPFRESNTASYGYILTNLRIIIKK